MTIKRLKKKHSFRLVGGVEMGSWVERTHGKAVAEGQGWARWQLAYQEIPHLFADKLGGKTGEPDRPHNTGFQHGKSKPQNLWL